MPKGDQKENDKLKIPIKWESAEAERAQFANHATVHFDGSVYTLRFYQVLPPVEVNLPKVPKQIVARHVVTLAISAGDMVAITQLLQGIKTNDDPDLVDALSGSDN